MGINWNGCPPIPLRYWRLRRRTRILLERHPNLYITSTVQGAHARGSYHYLGRAVDFGSNSPTNAPEKKAMRTCSEKWGNNWTELLGPLDYHVFSGHRYAGMYPGHGDHLHIAL